MKVLDDIYCGIQHDIPTAKECFRAIGKKGKGGWRDKDFHFDFGTKSDSIEYDEEEVEIIRGCGIIEE